MDTRQFYPPPYEPPKDGGPAFPNRPSSGNFGYAVDGMSLRDYFAGQSLVGMLANQETHLQGANVPSCYAFAEQAYGFADAMLKAREQS